MRRSLPGRPRLRRRRRALLRPPGTSIATIGAAASRTDAHVAFQPRQRPPDTEREGAAHDDRQSKMRPRGARGDEPHEQRRCRDRQSEDCEQVQTSRVDHDGDAHSDAERQPRASAEREVEGGSQKRDSAEGKYACVPAAGVRCEPERDEQSDHGEDPDAVGVSDRLGESNGARIRRQAIAAHDDRPGKDAADEPSSAAARRGHEQHGEQREDVDTGSFEREHGLRRARGPGTETNVHAAKPPSASTAAHSRGRVRLAPARERRSRRAARRRVLPSPTPTGSSHRSRTRSTQPQ